MHSCENDDVLSCEPLNHIHQNTKSARLIAVCKRSFIKLVFLVIMFLDDVLV